jgi:hypothetical protein
MAFAFDVTSNIPRLTQSGTDSGLGGIATAINALPSVARSTAYTTAMMRKPPVANGMWYRCSVAGTTAATAPTYNPTVGSTTIDGTARFVAFKAPDIQTLGTTNFYYMPDVRMNITGALTNANPQQQSFLAFDVFVTGASANFISGAWANDGVTPLWDGVHFATTRTTTSGAIPIAFFMQSGSQCTFIGGEIQCSGGVEFAFGTTPRSYLTRWRATKEFGASSSRFRSSSTTAIFQDVEAYDFAFDLFRMPTTPPSIRARGSEYTFQYVGFAAGGVDAKFVASNIENPNGTYDFDNWGCGWVELYNCKQGAELNVFSQQGPTPLRNKHCVPLYQDLIITARDTAGVVVPDVRFTTTETPTNSPTITITTNSNLKTWDFRNPATYETTTDANGVALSSPVLNVWYFETSFKESLRFPSSTAIYQGRAYNYKTMNVSVLLGASAAIPVSAGMIGLDTETTVDEATAGAITGISLVPSGATGGTITISSNKEYQDIWNYYRWWISQYANRASNDTWTCTGGTLNTQNWNIVVADGVTLSDSDNIQKIRALGSITLTGTAQITGIYQDSTGTSTVLEISGFDAGSAVYVEDNSEVEKFYSASTSGTVTVYIPPTGTGSWYYAVEKYGIQRQSDFFTFSGGLKQIVVKAIPDIGLTESNIATVAAYTALENPDKIYDYVAYLRTTTPHISYGQILFKDGTSLYLADSSMLVDQSFGSVASFNYDTKLLTIKSLVLGTGVSYTKIVADPPSIITANTNEIITILIEDANGDSRLSILGGDNEGYELWKVTTATATDDYETGELLITLPDNVEGFRFIGISGFDIVGRDISSGVRRRSSMLKGNYTQSFYVGDQIQLSTNAPQLVENNQKLDELILKVDNNLDVAVSTRLAAINYVEPDNDGIAESNTKLDDIQTKVDTLENTDLTGIALEATSQQILTTVQDIDVDFTPVLDAIDLTLKTSQYTAPDNVKIGQIKTKVDTLENTNISTLATTVQLEEAKDEILANSSGATPEEIADQVWLDQPDRLKNVSTVQITGEQLKTYIDN